MLYFILMSGALHLSLLLLDLDGLSRFVDDCTRLTWQFHKRMVLRNKKNHHLLKSAHTLLIRTHVPRRHWDDIIITAVYLLNRMPYCVFYCHTPVQVVAQYGPMPSILMLTLRVFGCVFNLHKNQRSKRDPYELRCVFLGYSTY